MSITRAHTHHFHFNFNPADYAGIIRLIRQLPIRVQYKLYCGAMRAIAQDNQHTNEGNYAPCLVYAVNPIVKREVKGDAK